MFVIMVNWSLVFFVCLFFPDLTGSLRFRQNGHENNKIFSHIYIYCNALTAHKQKIVPLKAEEYMQSNLYLSPILVLLLINYLLLCFGS